VVVDEKELNRLPLVMVEVLIALIRKYSLKTLEINIVSSLCSAYCTNICGVWGVISTKTFP